VHAEVIQIAEWTTDDKDELQPIEPQRTGAILGLDKDSEIILDDDEDES